MTEQFGQRQLPMHFDHVRHSGASTKQRTVLVHQVEYNSDCSPMSQTVGKMFSAPEDCGSTIEYHPLAVQMNNEIRRRQSNHKRLSHTSLYSLRVPGDVG